MKNPYVRIYRVIQLKYPLVALIKLSSNPFFVIDILIYIAKLKITFVTLLRTNESNFSNSGIYNKKKHIRFPA